MLYETALKKNQFSCGDMVDISEKIEAPKSAYTVNVYPQAINRDCCDKNHQSGAQKHWDTQIISHREW
jgi:hypothetical protein